MSNGTNSLIKDQPHIVRQSIAEHLTERSTGLFPYERNALSRGAMTYAQLITDLQMAININPAIAHHPVSVFQTDRTVAEAASIQIMGDEVQIIAEKLGW